MPKIRGSGVHGRVQARARNSALFIGCSTRQFCKRLAIVNPGFNKQSGTFAGAIQVFQVPHENTKGDMETKLARLAAQMDGIKEAVQAA